MAQDDSKSASTDYPFEDFIVDDSVNRYSLGINVQPGLRYLFKRNTAANIEMILRKQVGKYNAIRYGLTYYSAISTDTEGIHQTTAYSHTIGLSAGYEWQKLLSHRWKGYYGVDLGGSTRLFNQRQENTQNEAITQEHTSNTYNINVLPFLGFRYNITPYLFLSTEIKILAQYRINELKYGETYVAEHTENFGYSPDWRFNQFAVNFRPFTGIYLHYIF